METCPKIEPVNCGCGGKAQIETVTTRFEQKPRFRIICEKCKISTIWDYFSEAEAVEAWNLAMGSTEKSSTVERTWQEVGKTWQERTAKVERLNMVTENNRVYKCENCGQYMHRTAWSNPVKFCPNCGTILTCGKTRDEINEIWREEEHCSRGSRND